MVLSGSFPKELRWLVRILVSSVAPISPIARVGVIPCIDSISPVIEGIVAERLGIVKGQIGIKVLYLSDLESLLRIADLRNAIE